MPKITDDILAELAVLSTVEMAAADSLAQQGGLSGKKLMENAGRAVVTEITARWKRRRVIVLAGPGNNGGDGFVIARLLKKKGWPVSLYLLGEVKSLKGDAAHNARRWQKDMKGRIGKLDAAAVKKLDTDALCPCLVIDALFGTGLSRPLKGAAASLVKAINRRRMRRQPGDGAAAPAVVAVDIPSGLDADRAKALGGVALRADLCVTFCRPQPAHLLSEGQAYCTEVVVADIDIGDGIVTVLKPQTWRNDPRLWPGAVRWPDAGSHKHNRGRVIVLGGKTMTGAARLAALAARRGGAGWVAVAAPQQAVAVYAVADDPGTIIISFNSLSGFKKVLDEHMPAACVLGPGAGLGPGAKATRDRVLAALTTGAACVLDADALSAFAATPETLFWAIGRAGNEVVLTPHSGEFDRLFGSIARPQTGPLAAARAAARLAGAVVVLKGATTVIAAPDGRAILAPGAPAELATAGSGDVLAGVIAALMASSTAAFEAAAAAVWLHSRAGERFVRMRGPGLIAEDLIAELPAALADLKARR